MWLMLFYEVFRTAAWHAVSVASLDYVLKVQDRRPQGRGESAQGDRGVHSQQQGAKAEDAEARGVMACG